MGFLREIKLETLVLDTCEFLLCEHCPNSDIFFLLSFMSRVLSSPYTDEHAFPVSTQVMGVVYLDQAEDELARQRQLIERDTNFGREQ